MDMCVNLTLMPCHLFACYHTCLEDPRSLFGSTKPVGWCQLCDRRVKQPYYWVPSTWGGGSEQVGGDHPPIICWKLGGAFGAGHWYGAKGG